MQQTDQHLHCWSCGKDFAVLPFLVQPSVTVIKRTDTDFENSANLNPKFKTLWTFSLL